MVVELLAWGADVDVVDSMEKKASEVASKSDIRSLLSRKEKVTYKWKLNIPVDLAVIYLLLFLGVSPLILSCIESMGK